MLTSDQMPVVAPGDVVQVKLHALATEAGTLELAALSPPEAPAEQQPYLEVRVLLEQPEPGLRARIEAALEGKQVRLAKIETSTAARASSIDKEVMTLDQLEKLKPDDIFKQLYQQRFGNEAPADQLSAFAELMLP